MDKEWEHKLAKAKKTAHPHAEKWIGRPVCTVLQDGSYYIGQVKGIKNGKLVISGVKGSGRVSSSTGPTRAQISGLIDSMLGGNSGGTAVGVGAGAGAVGEAAEAGAGAGTGNSAGFGGMMRTISIGINMIQMIMPLLQFFRV